MQRAYCLITIPVLTPRQQLQIKALQDNGFDVHSICWDRFGIFPKDEVRDGVHFVIIQKSRKKKEIRLNEKKSYITLWGDGKKGLRTLLSLLCLWVGALKRLILEKPGVIICYHLIFLPLAVLVAKIKMVVVVYDISEFAVDQALNWIPPALRPLGGKLLERFEDMLLRQTNGVTCVPDRIGMIYNKISKNCRNIEIILNVPELECRVDRALHSDLQKRYARNKVVVYAGALRKSKGIIEAVKAVKTIKKSYPNIMLLLIGSCIGDDTDLINDYTKREGLDENINIITFQPYEKLYTYYLCANIGLTLPYRGAYEENLTIGNTRKNLDYIKASLPVIVPDLGEMGLLVKQEGCGMIVPTCDATSISQAILFLLDNPTVAEKMGKNGYEAFLKKYNWDIEKKKFMKVYNAL